MVTTTGNTIHSNLAGIVVANGTSAVTAHAVSQYNVVAITGASNQPGGIAPSTAGFVLTSNGASAVPSFQAPALPIAASTTFTPVLKFGGGTTGITYTNQYGYYVNISNLVWFHLDIKLSNKGSSTGAATITGLPVSTGTNSNVQTAPISYYVSLTLTAGYTTPFVYLLGSSSVLNIAQSGSGSTAINMDDTMFANTSEFSITGFYITD